RGRPGGAERGRAHRRRNGGQGDRGAGAAGEPGGALRLTPRVVAWVRHIGAHARPESTDVVNLPRDLPPPIGAQRLRGSGAVLGKLIGNSVPLPGNPSERDPPRIPGDLRFDLLLAPDKVL